MELKTLSLELKNPEVIENPTIEFNYSQLKQTVLNISKTYQAMEYSEENIQQARADRATLNKFQTALDNRRKEMQKIYMQPFDEFKEKIDELRALIKEPIAQIDQLTNEYQQKRLEERAAFSKNYYEEKAKEIGFSDVFTWENFKLKEYEQLSPSDKKIKDDIDSRLEKAVQDWATIENMSSPFEADMKKTFLQGYDLSEALATGQMLREKEEERKAYQAAQEKRQAEKETNRQTALNEVLQGLGVEKTTEKEPKSVQKEKSYTLQFQVTGTKQQLLDLASYAKANGLSLNKI